MMLEKIPGVVTLSLALAAIGITLIELFPRSGHLGPEADIIKRLIDMVVPAVIATVVILLFRAVRGNLNLKLPILGAKRPLEFSVTQTQASLWCLVYSVVKLL